MKTGMIIALVTVAAATLITIGAAFSAKGRETA